MEMLAAILMGMFAIGVWAGILFLMAQIANRWGRQLGVLFDGLIGCIFEIVKWVVVFGIVIGLAIAVIKGVKFIWYA